MALCRLVVVVLALSWSVAARTADPPISAAEAKDHIGKRLTVCGVVTASSHAIAPGRGGKQTFLYFDQAPALSKFVAVVVGNDLAGGGVFFGIEKRVEQKHVCITGYIKPRGADGAMMLLDAPNQLKIVEDATP